jgi:hypothetical protein
VVAVAVAAIVLLALLGKEDDKSSGEGGADSAGDFTPGSYVRLASMRRRAAAEHLAGLLSDRGVPARVINSDEVEELFPGFAVVVSGPVRSKARARTLIRRAKGLEITDAVQVPLSPASGGPIDVSGLNGAWRGTLSQAGAARAEDNRQLATAITFAAGGRRARIRYPGVPCSGDLSFVRTDGAIAVYSQRITFGDCPQGGTWMLRLRDSRLAGTWRRQDAPMFIAGYLTR